MIVRAILTVGRSSGLKTQPKDHSGMRRNGMGVGIERTICQTFACSRRKNAGWESYIVIANENTERSRSIVRTDAAPQTFPKRQAVKGTRAGSANHAGDAMSILRTSISNLRNKVQAITGLLILRETWLAAACVFLVMSHSARCASYIDAFTNIVNPENTSGHMVLSNAVVAGSTEAGPVVAYSWVPGQFLAEFGPLLGDARSPLIEPTVNAYGTWLGTNWEYSCKGGTNKQLVIYLALSKEQQEFLNDLGGRWPARYEFDRILARGMDYRTFMTLRIHSGDIEATYQGKVPVSGKLTEAGASEMVFAYTIAAVNLSYLNRIRLEPFQAGGYLASRLASWTVTATKTNLTSDYTLLSAGTNPLHTSLSPFTLYRDAELMELSHGRLYTLRTGLRQQSPQPRAEKHLQVKLRRGIVLVVLIAFGLSAFWLFFPKRRRL